MKIGIIVYSHTGNTHSIAKKLEEKLSKGGHSVNIERVTVANDINPRPVDYELERKPKIKGYDALIFGSPVEAFSLSPVMIRYLKQVASLEDKKTACLVTQFFPFRWMGGNRAAGQMRKICESGGAKVCGYGVVNWMGERRRGKITKRVVEELSELFR